ncbi:MAG TPA: shikimate kinase [Phnomibacter sp.]|nr:shikimate kinase [Phnomibacter sp.]
MNRVYLVGIMGSGKSHWGTLLAKQMHLPFVDLDEFIEQREGKSIPAIFEADGEAYFRELESAALKNDELLNEAVISCGGGTPCFFDNMEFMLKHGVVIWLHPDTDVIVERIWKVRERRPLIAAASSEEEVAAIINSIVEKRKAWYAQADITLTDAAIDLPALVASILRVQKNKVEK